MGTPQYLCLERHQSGLFSTMADILDSPAFGTQFILDEMASSIFSLRWLWSIFIKYCSVALNIIGFLQRQQCGYECVVSSSWTRTPRDFNLSIIFLFAFSTSIPLNSPAVLSNLPFGSIGIIMGRLYFFPVR